MSRTATARGISRENQPTGKQNIAAIRIATNPSSTTFWALTSPVHRAQTARSESGQRERTFQRRSPRVIDSRAGTFDRSRSGMVQTRCASPRRTASALSPRGHRKRAVGPNLAKSEASPAARGYWCVGEAGRARD